jgi:hypothetical protein
MRRLAWLAIVLVPAVAEACAACLSSPYGDRTYNWAYLGLMLMPLALVIAVGGVLTGCYLGSRRNPGSRRKDNT